MRGGRLGLGGELFGDESKEKGEQLYARLCRVLKFCGGVYNILGLSFGGELIAKHFCDNPLVAVWRYWD